MELEGGLGEFEVIEGEASAEGETTMRRGHEGARGHRDEGGSGVAGLDFEPMPESGGDLTELALGDEVEIEDDEREISVAQEQVGTLERLLGFGAAEPDEVVAFFVPIRSGIEGVATIDESEGEVAFLLEEFGDDEGGSGGVAWRDDFAEMAGREFQGGGLRRGFFGGRSTMSGRKLLAKLAAELLNLQDAQNVFIRTFFWNESRRWRSNIK